MTLRVVLVKETNIERVNNLTNPPKHVTETIETGVFIKGCQCSESKVRTY